MRIGKLAATAGVTAHTLRFWERSGLLPDPGRTSGGYRHYPPEAVERVTFVRRAQSCGLTLEQIKIVLDVDAQGHVPCPQVTAFVDARVTEIDARLAELAHTRARLEGLRARLDTLSKDRPDERPSGVCPAIDCQPA